MSRSLEIVRAIADHQGDAIAVLLSYSDALEGFNMNGMEITAVRGVPVVRRGGIRTYLITADDSGEPTIQAI